MCLQAFDVFMYTDRTSLRHKNYTIPSSPIFRYTSTYMQIAQMNNIYANAYFMLSPCDNALDVHLLSFSFTNGIGRNKMALSDKERWFLTQVPIDKNSISVTVSEYAVRL